MSTLAAVTAILSAILWGVAYVASGEALKQASPAAVYLALCAAVLSLAPLAFWVEAPVRVPQVTQWKDLILSGVSAAAALWLGYIAIANSNALQASIVDISYPLWAALAGWLLYSQRAPNVQTLLGGGFIILGGAIILFSEKP